tara:strand:+ start:563 stop:916 length:354 start_codon:yes stop_codon:yes gene_type:complete
VRKLSAERRKWAPKIQCGRFSQSDGVAAGKLLARYDESTGTITGGEKYNSCIVGGQRTLLGPLLELKKLLRGWWLNFTEYKAPSKRRYNESRQEKRGVILDFLMSKTRGKSPAVQTF